MAMSASRFHRLAKDFAWLHQGIGVLGSLLFFIGSTLFLWSGIIQRVAIYFFIVGSFGMLIGSAGSSIIQLKSADTDSTNMHRRNFSPFYLRLCGLTGLIGCIGVVATDIAGILAYEPYNWIGQTISALAVGPYGWIQDIGLYLLGVGLIADGVGLFMWRRSGIAWSIGCLLLVLLGADIFTIMAVNDYAGRQNVGADIHQYCVYALGILIMLLLFCFAPGLWRWRSPWGKFSVAIGVFWIILSSIYLLVPISWTGAYERALALLAIAWFAAVSDLLRRQGRFCMT